MLLSNRVTAITLPLGDFGLRCASFVSGERATNTHLLFEFAALVTTHVAFVAFVRFDEGAFGGGFLGHGIFRFWKCSRAIDRVVVRSCALVGSFLSEGLNFKTSIGSSRAKKRT